MEVAKQVTEKRQIITQQIVEMVSAEPGLTAKQISEKLVKKEKTIKVVLHRLVKTNRIAREKIAHGQKSRSGPEQVYVYKSITV